MPYPEVPFQKKKKTNHDVAYLLMLLGLFFGAFIFVAMMVNYLLRSLPIP